MISTRSLDHTPTQEYVVPRSIPMAEEVMVWFEQVLTGIYVGVEHNWCFYMFHVDEVDELLLIIA